MAAHKIDTPGADLVARVGPGVSPTIIAHRHGSYASDCTCSQPIAPGSWRPLWNDGHERHPWCKP